MAGGFDVGIDTGRRGGLERSTLTAWRARIGADQSLGRNPTRYLRRVGQQGLDNHMETFHVDAEPAEDFEEYLYWRPLSQLMVFSLLRTPCTTERTADLIRRFRSEFVLVGTQHLPGGGTVTQSGRTFRYSHPRHLVAVNNDEPFVQVSNTVADLAGVWVPIELLDGRPNEEWSMEPLVDDSPLARATAAYIASFANDVAVRRADIDTDTQVAVAELIRAALSSHRGDNFRAADSELYVREITGKLIEQNFRDPTFDVESIARLLFLSRRHLYRAFAGAEQTPAVLIAQRRLAAAKALLVRDSRMSLREVAAACGFASAGTLSKRFRAEFDLTPSEFRKAVRAGEVSADG